MTCNDDIYRILNPNSAKPVIVLCDHGGKKFPDNDDFGLTKEQLTSDVVCDWGTEKLASLIGQAFGCFTILPTYSRLLCDLNRYPDTENVIPQISQRGFAVPGNKNLSENEKRDRLKHYFWPYHDAVTQKLFSLQGIKEQEIAIISIHSFAPEYDGVNRPWPIGVMVGDDERMTAPFIKNIQESFDINLGINEPYTVKDEIGYGFSVNYHAIYRSLPHIMLEIRQNELTTDAQCQNMAKIINSGLQSALSVLKE